MPRFRAICFDLFNTLVSVGQVPEQVGRFTADILGIDHDVWNEACFGPHHEICLPTDHLEVIRNLAHSIDPTISHDLIEQAMTERQRRFDHALLNVEKEILDSLYELKRAGYRLGLISNASTGEVLAWQQSRLAGLFELPVFSCDCGMKKPDVSIYLHALEGLDVDAKECVYVGDGGSHEFHGASAAGMHTILTKQFLKPERHQRVLREQAGSIRGEIDHIRHLLKQLAV